MSKRHFSNFLSAYMDYALDAYCPDKFHLWTGLSILAASLERKVRLTQRVGQSLLRHYPNIYVLLLSHPGSGKSTALERGTDLLEEMKVAYNPNFKIIPNQATEAGLIELMKIKDEFKFGANTYHHSSAFFYASEASSSAMQNTFGNFNATITAFYDCPMVFRKKLKGEKDTTEIYNVSMSLLAATTFDYLKTVVNEESVMGGLASRLIYVINKDRFVRRSKWVHELDYAPKESHKLKKLLIEDLAHINKLIGGFRPTAGYIQAWEKAQPEFDEYLIGLNSPRMESIMARKFTNQMKLSMLLSVSEDDSLVLKEEHFYKAQEMIDDVTKDNAFVLSSAVIAKIDSQAGLTQLILQTLKQNNSQMTGERLRQTVIKHGNDVNKYNTTLSFLRDSHDIELLVEDGKTIVKLLRDPDLSL